MKYQALARTWRPKSFSEMVGQEHVVKALSNALDKQRIHHAYLFTGTRGVGKTTVARIFAKALNCQSGPTATPCGSCSSCVEIDSGSQVDLIEVDAASRTGVEHTRELLDNVQYRPVSSRYKIYLIDEVHMFSTSSFNALLKTLEEPPEHVKFLLATTDPKKCPITVLSRCLQFNLHPLAYGNIAKHLEKILLSDNIEFEQPALNIIAQAANGSLRDSLSLLDQAISYSPDKILQQDVVNMLGAASINSIIELANNIASNKPVACLTLINQLACSSVNFIDALDQLISLYHQVAVFNITGICDDENIKPSISKLNSKLSAEEIQLNYQILLSGKKDFLLAANAQSGFEMLILRLIAFRPQGNQIIVEAKKLASPISSLANPPIAVKEVKTQVEKKQAPIEQHVTETIEPIANHSSQTITVDNWHLVASNLGLKAIAKQLADNCVFQSLQQGVITLKLPEHFSILLTDEVQSKFETALKKYSSDIIAVTIEITKKEQVASATPAEIKQQSNLNHQEELKQSFLNDAVVQSLQQEMDARLIPDSIQEITNKED